MADTISIVVPTHNRAARLPATLEALGRIDWPASALEVIIVADGCTDGTVSVCEAWTPPFRARVIAQASQGPAAARNRGAAEAAGDLLIFLDDDVLAGPALARAHATAHAAATDRVVIGYLSAAVRGDGFFAIALRGWWEAMFRAMRRPGHRFSYRDLLAGNFSVRRNLFERMGGFDPSLRCHEDYELGLRLIEGGARFVFAPDAVGIHDERTTLEGALRRKYEEGRADVSLRSRRPALARSLPMAYMAADTRRRRWLRGLAVSAPPVGDALARLFVWRLGAYEFLRLRFRWRELLEDLFFYWYWRGVMSTGARPVLREMPTPPAIDAVSLDLAEGVDAAAARLDRETPSAMTLRLGSHLVGRVEPRPGEEPLRGDHLRRLLAEDFVDPYLRALALAGALPPWIDTARLIAECQAAPSPEAAAAEDSPVA